MIAMGGGSVNVFIDEIIKNARSHSNLLPCEDSSCSLITCNRVLETLPDLELLLKLLHDIVRVCANGARVDISARHPLHKDYLDDPYCRVHLTYAGLQTLLQDEPCPAFTQIKASLNLESEFSALVKELKLDSDAIAKKANGTPNSIRSTDWSFIVEKSSNDPGHLTCLTHIAKIEPYPFKVYRDFQKDKIVSRLIAQMGVWEELETNLVRTILQAIASKLERPLRFFNVGANIGWYSALALHSVPRIEVTAFEPVSSNFTLLQKNVIAKEGQQVTLHQIGLSDQDEETKIYVEAGNMGGSSLILRPGEDPKRAETITLKRLDSLYPHDRARDLCDFLMMDIEGAEHKFFNGAEGLLNNGFRPIICMEFCPLLLKAQGSDGTYVKDLEKLGYSFYMLNCRQNSVNKISTEQILVQYADINRKNIEALLDLLAVPEHIDLPALVG